MNKLNFKLPEDVSFILNELNKYGEGYLVGGSVRDLALNTKPNDFDFTTNIEYSKLKDIFKDFTPKEIGQHFGIIMIKVNDESYEIAKYRKDIGIKNSRHPEKIVFIDNIEDDLQRRDFTINAMAYNEKTGLLDMYNGQKDITNKIIRFVGDPDLRIQEDALRILRAVRFAARYNFKLDKKAEISIIDNKLLLNKISKERIQDEFSKILIGNNPDYAIQLLIQLQLLEIIFPLLQTVSYTDKNIDNVKKIISKSKPILASRLTIFFYNLCFTNFENISNITKITETSLSKLKFSNDIIKIVLLFIKEYSFIFEKHNRVDIKNFMNEVGRNNIETMLDIFYTHLTTIEPTDLSNYNMIENEIRNILSKDEFFEKDRLDIDGNDIVNMGYNEKDIQSVKSEVYYEIISCKLKNSKLDILNYIAKKKNIELIEKKKTGFIFLLNENGNDYIFASKIKNKYTLLKVDELKNNQEAEQYLTSNMKIKPLHIYKCEQKIKYISSKGELVDCNYFVVNLNDNTLKDMELINTNTSMKLTIKDETKLLKSILTKS